MARLTNIDSGHPINRYKCIIYKVGKTYIAVCNSYTRSSEGPLKRGKIVEISKTMNTNKYG